MKTDIKRARHKASVIINNFFHLCSWRNHTQIFLTMAVRELRNKVCADKSVGSRWCLASATTQVATKDQNTGTFLFKHGTSLWERDC